MKTHKINVDGKWFYVSENGDIATVPYVDKAGFNRKSRKLKVTYTRQGYAMVTIATSKRLNATKHRLVAQAFMPGFYMKPQVDHIDGNKDNNHISNLRMATNSENQRAYVRPNVVKSSIYRGVSWNKSGRYWEAYIRYNGKGHYLGSFDVEEDAAEAYDNKAVELGFSLEALNFRQHFVDDWEDGNKSTGEILRELITQTEGNT